LKNTAQEWEGGWHLRGRNGESLNQKVVMPKTEEKTGPPQRGREKKRIHKTTGGI